MRPSRLIRSAIVLKPSTLLYFHHVLKKRKYRLLFSPRTLSDADSGVTGFHVIERVG